jgi:hypothetical protein
MVVAGCGESEDSTTGADQTSAPSTSRAEVGVLKEAQRAWEFEAEQAEAETDECKRSGGSPRECGDTVFVPGEEAAAKNLQRNVGGILYNERIGPKCEHALRLLMVRPGNVGFVGAEEAVAVCEAESR